MNNNLRLLVLLVFVAIAPAYSYSQEITPLYLAQKIFGKQKFRDLKKYVTGEYKGKPAGTEYKEVVNTKFLVLGQSEKKAVVAVTLMTPKREGFDAYLHFVKEDTWKMCAFRGLAMTGMIEMMMLELEKMTPAQIDEEIRKAEKEGKEDTMFTSREDYEFTLGNSRLTVAFDDSLVAHFQKNKSEFERLKDTLLFQAKDMAGTADAVMNIDESMKPTYRKLFVSSASTGGYELGGGTKFLIGGILDNTVGYVFFSNLGEIPEMSPEDIIMLREIGSGWYLYKTT